MSEAEQELKQIREPLQVLVEGQRSHEGASLAEGTTRSDNMHRGERDGRLSPRCKPSLIVTRNIWV